MLRFYHALLESITTYNIAAWKSVRTTDDCLVQLEACCRQQSHTVFSPFS